MSPDDPRHGSEAGRAAHRRDNDEVCHPCRRAGARADKRRRAQGSNLVPLGRTAWAKVSTTPLPLLARASGVSECALINMLDKDGVVRVKPETRARIVSAEVVTTIGLVRRVQALSALGWSARDIARHAGLNVHNVLTLLNNERRYVRKDAQERVLRTYKALQMTTPAPSRWSTAARQLARRKGFAPPLAWDSIDDPNETPTRGGRDSEMDPVIVMRLLEGRRVKANRAEREEAIRRWVEDGGSKSELCGIHGWEPGRYMVQTRLTLVRGGAA